MKILAFGIAKDIFGNSIIDIPLNEATINELRNLLEEKFPQLYKLGSYMIAVNNEYALNSLVIKNGDEVAIIPPVSGG